MRWAWRIHGALVLLLAVGYVAAWVVTDRQRESAAARVLAMVEEARVAQEAALAREAGDRPREVVPLMDVHELIEPFGKSLHEDATWQRFANEIGFDGPWERGDLEDARAWLNTHGALLSQARAIADRHMAIENVEPLMTTKLLSDQMFLNCGRLLWLSMIMEHARGDVDAAFDDFMRCMEIADLAGTPHWLIWQAIRRALYRHVLEYVPEILEDLSDEQRAMLAARLATAYGRTQSVVGAAGELAILVENVSGITESPLGTAARPWMNANLIVTMSGMPALIQAARDPFHADAILIAPSKSRIPLFFRMGESQRDMLYANYATLIQDQAVHEASVDVTLVGIALWEHRADTGAPPDSLDALAPRLGVNVPVDPFTEKPMEYRRLGEFFELRSVGPNGVDDTGTIGRREDDIVWRGN